MCLCIMLHSVYVSTDELLQIGEPIYPEQHVEEASV